MDGHTPSASGLLSLGACIGPMARTIEDLSLLFDVIAGATTSEPNQRTSPLEEKIGALRGLRFSWYADDGIAPVTGETRAAVISAAKVLGDAGLEVSEERPPGISRGAALWIELFSGTASAQLREFYRGREDQAGARVAPFLRDRNDEANLGGEINKAETVVAAELERLQERIARRDRLFHLGDHGSHLRAA